MRIRIDRDVAKHVNQNRKPNKRSAHKEVNMALACHYAERKPRRKVMKL